MDVPPAVCAQRSPAAAPKPRSENASPQARVAPSFRSVITTKMAGESAPSRFRFAEQKAKAQVEAGRRDSAKGRKGSILGKVIRSASFDSAQKRVRSSRGPSARDPRHPDPPPDAFAPRARDRRPRRPPFDVSDAPPSAGGGVAARSRELEALHQHGTPPASRSVPARRASRAPGVPRRSSRRFGGRRSSRRSARSERDRRRPPAPRHSRRGERRAEQCRHPRAHCRV